MAHFSALVVGDNVAQAMEPYAQAFDDGYAYCKNFDVLEDLKKNYDNDSWTVVVKDGSDPLIWHSPWDLSYCRKLNAEEKASLEAVKFTTLGYVRRHDTLKELFPDGKGGTRAYLSGGDVFGLSFRGLPDTDLAQTLAISLGGGGHKQAAGAAATRAQLAAWIIDDLTPYED